MLLLLVVLLSLCLIHFLTERSPANGQASDRRYDYM